MDLNLDFIVQMDHLAQCNPFSQKWLDAEKKILRTRFVDEGKAWHFGMTLSSSVRENISSILEMSHALEAALKEKEIVKLSDALKHSLENLILFNIFHEFEEDFLECTLEKDLAKIKKNTRVLWQKFDLRIQNSFLSRFKQDHESGDKGHIFALFFQMRRAFYMIITHIRGSSLPSTRLRSEVWESIFTHQLIRYQDGMYKVMGDIPSLICGPSGSGKELVAKALGYSRYIPFDEKTESFLENHWQGFRSLNLSALNPTLIEAELFGHARGAFTGAVGERKGWLEECSPHGTIFLDEIGDVSPEVQVKLLRVLQSRGFSRVGETEERTFAGKIIAATHKDIEREVQQGRIRQDFFYRLCADVIHVPSLFEILSDEPKDLANILQYMGHKFSGPTWGEQVAKECEDYILRERGLNYPWQGNFRELEQCLRNFMVHGGDSQSKIELKGNHFRDKVERLEVNLDELSGEYLWRCYQKEQSYEKVAQRINCDRRTVKVKIDAYLNLATSLDDFVPSNNPKM